MPFVTIPGTSERYALLSFDKHGKERSDEPGNGTKGELSREILSKAAAGPPSHIFFFSHGWKGDLDSARDQYDRWIKAMIDSSHDRAEVKGEFKPLWIGLHWPSLPFGDEELGGNSFDNPEGNLSPDQLVATYLDRLAIEGDDAKTLLQTIVHSHQKNAAAEDLPADARAAYAKLATLAGYKSAGPSGPPDAEGAPFDPDKAFEKGQAAGAEESANFGERGGVLGGILGPLRQLSYWTMKKRARTLGESGMHRLVAELMNRAPQARVHLMGHSFGTIVVSSILGGEGATGKLPRPVDSVALIQGAVSLWAFGEKIQKEARKGYFNPWVNRGAVRGPILVSRSIHDRAVGTLYPWASAVSFSDASFDVDEDDLPFYGAIGKFGIRGVSGAVFRDMTDKNGFYRFAPGKIYNLESSKFIAKGGGLSGAHSDIDGPEVAHALWQAALV